MEHPSLQVDSLASTLLRSQRISSQNLIGIGVDISLGNQGIVSQIMLVQQLDGSLDTRLEKVVSRATDIPTLRDSLSYQEISLSRGEKDTWTVRLTEVDRKEWTHHTGRIVVLLVTHLRIQLHHLGQSRHIIKIIRTIDPVVPPSSTDITGFLLLSLLCKIGYHLVGQINVTFLIRLDFAALRWAPAASAAAAGLRRTTSGTCAAA